MAPTPSPPGATAKVPYFSQTLMCWRIWHGSFAGKREDISVQDDLRCVCPFVSGW